MTSGSPDYISFTYSNPSQFSYDNGNVIVAAGGPNLDVGSPLAVNRQSNQGQETNDIFVYPAGALGTGAQALICIITQNTDGSCPLTCQGNAGSQFFDCGETRAQIDGRQYGDCNNEDNYFPFSALVIGAA